MEGNDLEHESHKGQRTQRLETRRVFHFGVTREPQGQVGVFSRMHNAQLWKLTVLQVREGYLQHFFAEFLCRKGWFIEPALTWLHLSAD